MRLATVGVSLIVLASMAFLPGPPEAGAAPCAQKKTKVARQRCRAATSTTLSVASGAQYSQDEIAVPASSGWQYAYKPEFGQVIVKAKKVTTNSPPGFAQLKMKFTVPEFPTELAGDTPGRKPPRAKLHDVAIYFPTPTLTSTPSEQETGTQGDTTNLSGGQTVECYFEEGESFFARFEQEFWANPHPEFESLGLTCGTGVQLLVGTSFGGTWAFTYETSEPKVDALLSDLQSDTNAPLILVGTEGTGRHGCKIVFPPDGSVDVGRSISEGGCVS